MSDTIISFFRKQSKWGSDCADPNAVGAKNSYEALVYAALASMDHQTIGNTAHN